MKYSYKPVVLIVLDGFGIDTSAVNSPWQIAKHPAFSEIEKFWPFTALQASSVAIGLPWGEEGNSEVGHLTMGSGRIIYNHLPRIITAISDGSFFKNEAFQKAIKQVKERNSVLHLMGLFSTGSVHAYFEHVSALLELAKREGIKNVYIHLFTDGRDAPQREAANFIKEFKKELTGQYPMAKIASVIGRHFAMDRDGNWDLIEKAYKLLTEGTGNEFKDAVSYIEEEYKKGLNDEKIEPASIKEGRIKNGDAVIFWNFREDSARELTQAFAEKSFNKFQRTYLDDLVFVTMTEYDKRFFLAVAFPSLNIKWTLGAIISQAGLKQLRLAETEKYAHITYFFNGGVEKPFDNEERVLIPSPDVSFEEAPEMAAEKVTDTILASLSNYDFILANFANADMVGHTGNFNACVKAIEVLDYSIGKIVPKVLEIGGIVLITADHGNIEEKLYKITGEKRTKHSTNPVPFYLVAGNLKRKEPRNEKEIKSAYQNVTGTLADIAPTVLELFNLPKPQEMTGRSLLKKLK
jgi:2,3-bisphosphoglycerate-independent phosphoglycerate mutase